MGHPDQTKILPAPPATIYFIDGFRSLREFALAITPGLNVLVGPNGAGKTNFLDFLSFLDVLFERSATSAISASGGLARVFSQEANTRSTARLEARVHGTADLRDSLGQNCPDPFFSYEYEIEVRFSKSESSVYISHEFIRFRRRRADNPTIGLNNNVGVLELSRRSGLDEHRPRWNVGRRLYTENGRNPLASNDADMGGRPLKDKLIAPLMRPDQSVLSLGSRYYLPALEAIKQSITKGRSFNIVPERAREPDDLSKQGGIQRDGSGLTATLHALQTLRRSTRPRRIARLRRSTKLTLGEIVEWTRLVFPKLQDIIISQDAHTGRFLGSLVLESDPPLRIPFQAASDGTLKWLSLVTLLLTDGGLYSLEEPENFLHPKMLEYLVQLIRESIDDSDRGDYFLFSTHSETLINFCAPEELIIFDFISEATLARRIDDPNRIRAEINKTGFGLGYYYVHDALPKDHSLRRGHNGEVLRQQ